MSTRAAGPETEEVASSSRLLLGRDRVRGDAGIGKSALLAAAGERAHRQGLTVVSTTGVFSEAQLGYAVSVPRIQIRTISDGQHRCGPSIPATFRRGSL